MNLRIMQNSTCNFTISAPMQPSNPTAPLSALELTTLSSYLFILIALGGLGNSAIFGLFLACRKLQKPINALFVSLSIGDMMGCLGSSLGLLLHILMGFNMDGWRCKTYGFLTFCVGIADIYTLTCVSIERYLLICRKSRSSQQRVLRMVAFTWTLAVLLSGCPLVGWGNYHMVSYRSPVTFCTIDWHSSNIELYVAMVFIVVYIIPIAVISFCYTRVIHYVKSMAGHGQNQCSRAQKDVLKQSLIIILAFFIAWTPYALISLGETIGQNIMESSKLVITASLFAKTSFVWNPWVVLIMNKQFQSCAIDRLCFRQQTGSTKSDDDQDSNVAPNSNEQEFELMPVSPEKEHNRHKCACVLEVENRHGSSGGERSTSFCNGFLDSSQSDS